MSSFPINSPATLASISVLVTILLASPASSDIDQDRAECAEQLVGLATCLPYVGGGGDAGAPTLECCSGLKQVLQKNTKCLCILIKDRDDPKLGHSVNVTLALDLPSSCHTPTNLTRCIDLLRLPLNSTEAKVFGDFEKTLHAKSSAVPAPASADSIKSGGGKRKKLGHMEMIFIGLSASFFVLSNNIC